jgi:hypothetical protein
MRIVMILICWLALCGGPAAFAKLSQTVQAPLGDWICTGQNPGDQRPYRGQVSVIKSGQTYTVMWRFGTSTYIGTGVLVGDSFAVSFTQNQMTPQPNPVVGLVLFKQRGTSWEGQWTQMGSQTLGKENWVRLGNAPGSAPGNAPAAPGGR